MATFLQGVEQGIRDAFCIVLSTGEGAWALFVGADAVLGGDRDRYNRYLDKLRDVQAVRGLYCNRPEPPPPVPPPFPGGQCCDGSYLLNFQVGAQFGGAQFQVGGTGKILRIFSQVNSFGNWQNFVEFQRCDETKFVVAGRAGNSKAEVDSYSLINIVRTNGADNCGDPERPFPGPPPPVPVIINYEDNDVNISIPTNITFAPVTVNLDGTLSIPVNVNLNGELELNGTIELPDFEFRPNFNFGPRGGTPDKPINPDDFGPDAPENGEEQSEVIVGVHVYSRRVGNERATTIDLSNGPNLRVPRIATVQFGVRAGALTSWDTEFPVKTAAAWIPVRNNFGAVDVKVDWDIGWTGTFYIIRQPLNSLQAKGV